jgi:hypothetical protein
VGECWLQHARMCRAAGHYEAAETAALEAVARSVPGAVLQVRAGAWGQMRRSPRPSAAGSPRSARWQRRHAMPCHAMPCHAMPCPGAVLGRRPAIPSTAPTTTTAPPQRAKLLWDMERPQRAIEEVQRELARLGEAGGGGGAAAGRSSGAQQGGHPAAGAVGPQQQGRAKLALQLAKWTAERGTGGREVLTGLFEEAIGCARRWEKCYFAYAQYLDQLYQVRPRGGLWAWAGAVGVGVGCY